MANEIHWKQGKILVQIKDAVGHTRWLDWVEENLKIGRRTAARRLAIGQLSELPKLPKGTVPSLLNERGFVDDGREWHLTQVPGKKAPG